MRKRYATKVIFTSDWENDKKICHVHSKREIIRDIATGATYPTSVATFQFSGWNPFPCYSMHSTFGVVAKWMRENGWMPNGNYSKEIYYETIDTETGEILLQEKEKVITITHGENNVRL